ncbi:MAG TPA: UDP-N-acetylglucosamine 2-epimerase (non-hydrolyzing) [Clostridiaceae bacterium]|nr:UDP-N-acetylglucosamine 2-epimerase (non-hydrolyzing) [Clostridiaceae bacterium]
MKILSVFGTRPEAIKMAPLILEMRKRPGIESVVALTGQHRELLKSVLTAFGVGYDYDLDIMEGRQSLSHITTSVLEGINGIVRKEKPDIVLVHGDTTTSMAAALAAFYEKVPVGHVEAGLRTYDRYSPYPEEMNRTLTARLSDIHFAPTETAQKNLIHEGIPSKDIFVTGNTVIDAMKNTVKPDYVFQSDMLKKIDFNKKVIMVTAHRRENLESGIESISRALATIAQREDVEIIYLMHPNPRVLDTVKGILAGTDRVHLLPALDIIETHNLMARSHLILTDSGGIQEEAPYLGKPVLVLRAVTERTEAVDAGVVRLVGTEAADIVREVLRMLDDEDAYNVMVNGSHPYGDGRASERILDAVEVFFGVRRMADFSAFHVRSLSGKGEI